jgi:hypothetical protein
MGYDYLHLKRRARAGCSFRLSPRASTSDRCSPTGAYVRPFLGLYLSGGRSAQKRSEVLDPLHVVVLGLRSKLADRHVFDHAPAQRADGLVGHGGAPCP